jgi:HEAT repeat protein
MSGKLIGSILIALLLQVFVLKAAFCQEDLRLETWAENLKNEKVLIRKSAAKYLGALGDKRAIPPLLAALKDPEAEVRSEVCAALGLFGEESVKETLTNVLYKDPSPMVRFAAKTAIEKIDTYISLQKEKKIKEMKEKLKSSS